MKEEEIMGKIISGLISAYKKGHIEIYTTYEKVAEYILIEFPPIEDKEKEPELKVYYCTVCRQKVVDAENGYDTCSDCLSKM